LPLGAEALAARVDKASRDARSPGLALVAFVQRLGMARTTFDPTEAMTHPLAQSHPLDEGGQAVVQRRTCGTGRLRWAAQRKALVGPALRSCRDV
jgi:hypothetical protein